MRDRRPAARKALSAVMGIDTTHSATVYGGAGAGSIVIAGQTTGHQSLTVCGNEGAEIVSVAKGSGQTITVADF